MTPHRGPKSTRRSPRPTLHPPESSVETSTRHAVDAPTRTSRWAERHTPPEPHGERHTQHAPPRDAAHRWPDADSEAHTAPPPDVDVPWSEDEWSKIATECAARRGRKLSRRQLRLMAKRARRRQANSVTHKPKPRRAKPVMPVWRHLRRIAGVIALVALGELGLAALTAPQFSVHQVTNDPAPLTPPDAIEEAQRRLVGQNWLRASTAPVVTKLKQLPMVKDAGVRRQWGWPPVMHINIVERQAFARVGSGDEWWVVDEGGVPFRRAAADDAKLYAISSTVLVPEVGKALPKEQWQSAVEFAKTLADDTKQGHDWALRAIYFDPHGFASLRLADTAPGAAPGDRVLLHLGTGPWDKKLQRAREALQWFEATGRRAEVLNLVSYKRPIWTPRRQAQSSSDSNEHPA